MLGERSDSERLYYFQLQEGIYNSLLNFRNYYNMGCEPGYFLTMLLCLKRKKEKRKKKKSAVASKDRPQNLFL